MAVEEYTPDFVPVSAQRLKHELPVWGGFFHGNEYNFLIFGAQNPEEDDNKEVLRVVRYDHNWIRIAETSVYGANTVSPVYMGTLECAEHNGYNDSYIS